MRRLLIVLIISFAIAQVAYLFFENGIKKFNCISYPALNEIINGHTGYDILFLGSSRTRSHLNPCIIDPVTHLSSFNAGMEGSNSLEARMLLEAYLAAHKPPAYVIYNIEALTIKDIKKIRYPSLYLLFLNNDYIAKGVENTFTGTSLLRTVPFLRMFYFDDYTRSIALQGYFAKNEMVKGVSYCKGYASTKIRTIQTVSVNIAGKPEKNADISEIIKVAELCKKNNIQLIFHSTPVLFLNNQPTSFQQIPEVDSLAAAQRIKFIRFDTSRAYIKEDFFDLDHLNGKGSEKYSKMFAKELVRNGIHK